MREEWIGRYRRASNTFGIFIPKALREKLGWQNGDYLIVVPHGNVLMLTRVDKAMLIERRREPGSVATAVREVEP